MNISGLTSFPNDEQCSIFGRLESQEIFSNFQIFSLFDLQYSLFFSPGDDLISSLQPIVLNESFILNEYKGKESL